MNLEEIRKLAGSFEATDESELDAKIAELKSKGVAFLGCVAFLQANLHLSLSQAKDKLLDMDAWKEKKEQTMNSINGMLADFEEE